MPRFAVLSDSPQFDQPKAIKRACQSPVSSDDEFDFEPRKRSKGSQSKSRVVKKVSGDKVSKSTSNRASSTAGPKSKRTAVAQLASPKFVWYLLNCLKDSVQSKMSFEYGFGLGSIVPLPSASEWTNEQVAQFSQWLETLGFVSRPTVNATVYRIANKDALAIVQRYSGQVSTTPSNTQAMLSQMQAPPEDDNLAIVTAKKSPKQERKAFENYTRGVSSSTAAPRQRRPAARRPPPLSLMWGSPIQAVGDSSMFRPSHSTFNPRLSLDSMDSNPPGVRSARRLSICSIAEEPSQSSSASPDKQSTVIEIDEDVSGAPSHLDQSNESLDFDAIEDASTPFSSAVKRLSFGGILTKSSRLSLDTSIPEESSMDLLNVSRENVVVQSKKTRNHLRRLSRLDVVRSSDRRLSLFVPKTNVQLAPSPLDKANDAVRGQTVHRASRSKPTMPSAVASLVLASQFVEMTPLVGVVCKTWRRIHNEIWAWHQADYHLQPVDAMAATLYNAFPWGQYLSDGAYKQVFKVYSVPDERYEAVSVMDVRYIESTGNEHIVRQEIAHSLLFTKLADTHPNFLRIYSMFLSTSMPDESKWGSPSTPTPQGLAFGALSHGSTSTGKPSTNKDMTSLKRGLYQYIRMELCDGGNVEDYIRLDGTSNLIHGWSSLFFQMVFALYAGREQHQLRHYDIKLLNFFLQSTSAEGTTMTYAFEEKVFELTSPYWVKLADYGTADTSTLTLGLPIGVEHFTTLENTPIDFFLVGDTAMQGYAADTFALGLSLLHLLSGRYTSHDARRRI
ncbi:serine/threonine protein kinase, variant [Aphanomyces invadans]|uniref:Serine/threonine protein kinase, variant n=1 Tax=Aphanomyces invadans TaxID=157072 RepID=A0A024UJ25_9STRA|nr:serine/threonine protein kinase, variant [Aphanomyces invadans]ETW06406.1 serine/threonine protein kinase, variant [Aphanomyces invadans]|eukprot:XP_008864481.1 serine/threonine protein kinase, variant [Aphanomyces invadans]